MPEADLDIYEAVTKEHYLPVLVDRLKKFNAYWAKLSKGETGKFITEEETPQGKQLLAKWPVQLRYNKSARVFRASAPLPTPRTNQWITLQANICRIAGDMMFDGDVVQATSQEPTRYVKAVDAETKGLKRGLENELGCQVIKPSVGWRAIINGAGAGADATVTVDGPGTIWLEEGMPIESRGYSVTTGVGTVAAAVADSDISEGLADATAHQVGVIDEDNLTSFELEDYKAAAVTTEKWADDHFIFRFGSPDSAASTTPYEITGLIDLGDNYRLQAAGTSSYFSLSLGLKTLQGKDKSSYPKLDGIVIHNGGSSIPLTETLMQKGFDRLVSRIDVDTFADRYILMGLTLRRNFVNLMQSDRGYTADRMKLEGGYEGIVYNIGNTKVPIVDEFKVPDNMCFVPGMSDMLLHKNGDPQFINMTGSMFQQYTTPSGKYNKFTATLMMYLEQACYFPGGMLTFRDVN